MRLIDADALPIVTRGRNHHRKYVHADITDAPTIDAIPVEWLKEHSQISPVRGIAVKGLIEEWHKEQEADHG